MNYTEHAVERLEYMLTQSQRDLEFLKQRTATIGKELRSLRAGRFPSEKPVKPLDVIKHLFIHIFQKTY